LFVEHAAAVRAYALRRTDAASADDVVMEVFVIACRRIDAVPAAPLPWLLGCARRVLANQRRGARRAGALVARIAEAASAGAVLNDDADRLAAAVSELGELDREVLFLSAWEGLEPAAIAEVLGCSRAAARVRLHRARRRLVATIEGADRGVSRPAEAVR
jgi:RNA polymerase sigma-70 factor (ECF subfamily)